MKNKQLKGGLYIVSAAVIWAVTGILIQILTQGRNVSAIWIATLRALFAGIILLVYCAVKDFKSLFDIFKHRDGVIGLLTLTIFGSTTVQLTFMMAVKYSNAATATILQYVSPAMVIFVMLFVKHKKPTFRELLCTFLAICGVLLIATHGDLSSLSISVTALLWGLASAAELAFYTIYPTKLIKKYGTYVVSAWSMFLSGIVLCAIIQPWKYGVVMDGEVIGIMAYMTVFATVIAFCIYSIGVTYIGETKANILATMEPLSAFVLSVIFMHIDVTLYDTFGFVCILLITFILAYERPKTPKKRNQISYFKK